MRLRRKRQRYHARIWEHTRSWIFALAAAKTEHGDGSVLCSDADGGGIFPLAVAKPAARPTRARPVHGEPPHSSGGSSPVQSRDPVKMAMLLRTRVEFFRFHLYLLSDYYLLEQRRVRTPTKSDEHFLEKQTLVFSRGR